MTAYCTPGVHLDFSGGPLAHAPASAPTLACGVCGNHLTGLAGGGVGQRPAACGRHGCVGAPGRGGPGAGGRGNVPAGPGAGGAGGVGAAAPRPAGAGACVPGAVDGPGPAASAVPLARGASGFLSGHSDRAAAAGPGAAVRGAAARATAADSVLRGQRGAADAQRTAAAAAVQQEQPAVGLAAARGADGAAPGPSERGPTRSPRGSPVRPEPGAQRLRCWRSAPAGVPRRSATGCGGPAGRALLSAQVIRPRNTHLGRLSGNLD